MIKINHYLKATFRDNYRKGSNANSFHNLLIFDIGNELNMPYLSLNDDIKHFNKLNLRALITPSKSHQIRKGDKGAVDRFRIITPTQTSLFSLEAVTFRELQNLSIKFLEIESFIDAKSLNDGKILR